MKQTMTALQQFSGLLGQRLATSVDTPGMFLLFTWWKDKQSVNDFYYSDLHQQLAGTRGQALTNGTTFQVNQMPTQLGIEVLAPLPGGMQMGGGFIPKELFQQLPRLPGAAQ
jgi:heme-degrading monooxygenase HmoA